MTTQNQSRSPNDNTAKRAGVLITVLLWVILSLGSVSVKAFDCVLDEDGDETGDGTSSANSMHNIDALACGHYAFAKGRSATALGNHASAAGDSSTALGRNASAAGENSTALGRFASAAATDSTALGRNASAAGGKFHRSGSIRLGGSD